MEKVYAEAVLSALRKGADEKTLVDGLVANLKAKGRLKLLPGILRELVMKQARTRTLAPSIEVASEAERTAAIASAKAEGIEAEAVRVNPELIRGWRARSGGTLVDRSGKKALIELYRNIITN